MRVSHFLCVITQVEKPASQKEPTTRYTVKLRGAPFNVTEVCREEGREVPGSGDVMSWKERGEGASAMGRRGVAV